MMCLWYAGRGRDATLDLCHEAAHKIFQPLDETIQPIQFNLQEQLNEIHEHRRQRRSTCRDRYLLFVLDTSGSIGSATFNTMVNNISLLVPLFCDNTKVAAITFGSKIYHHFCFNCYNTQQAKSAIASIKYQGGSTHSGRTLKCTCEQILSTSCGLPDQDEYRNCPAPIDIIVITDGHSNGPLDVCNEVRCLHNHPFYDINTFTIGVKNYNQEELDCIADQNDLNLSHIFNMESFDELEEFLQAIITYLQTPIPVDPSDPTSSKNYRLCFDANTPFKK